MYSVFFRDSVLRARGNFPEADETAAAHDSVVALACQVFNSLLRMNSAELREDDVHVTGESRSQLVSAGLRRGRTNSPSVI